MNTGDGELVRINEEATSKMLREELVVANDEIKALKKARDRSRHWFYFQNDHDRYFVGFYDHNNHIQYDRNYRDKEDAARRVSMLSGGRSIEEEDLLIKKGAELMCSAMYDVAKGKKYGPGTPKAVVEAYRIKLTEEMARGIV